MNQMPEAMASHLKRYALARLEGAAESPIAEPKVRRTKERATASAVPAKIAGQST